MNICSACMQFSWVRQLRLPMPVVVMRRCSVVVFDTPEVIDRYHCMRRSVAHNLHDAGMVDTADVAAQLL